ncbi:MAG: dihydroorotase [Chitinophagaceae bacterium]|nr:dihydroorotase [Chitinophagaceae bacterium]
MINYLLKECFVVNEGKIIVADVFLANGLIIEIGSSISPNTNFTEINAAGKFLFPGVIDDQVHFREPGLTHKATIYSESKSAVAGGVTSFMEMPNTIPPALTLEELEKKYAIGASSSLANYSFFMGTSNTNVEEVLSINHLKRNICGIKMFMGSSTGNMLVDNLLTIDTLFRESELLIATHCEDEKIIKHNLEELKKQGVTFTPQHHPIIRNAEACFESSLTAIQIAKKYNTRLHILHITTAKELQLFSNMLPIEEKRITSEVCVHHLHYTADDYDELGYKIKCNPAIKSADNKQALWEALLDNRLDVIATDHAPHLLEEKQPPYEKAHSGLPLVQHSLQLMLYYYKQGKISLEFIAEKMSHAVAKCFQIENRGFIREGYYADLVLVDLNQPQTVSQDNIYYKCGWSPLEGTTLPATITHTWVNGNLVYNNGTFNESEKGMRLSFNR